MGPFKGWLHINDKVFSTQRFCVLFAVVFIRGSLFLFFFCSHLQNIIFLQSLKNKGHVFHLVLFSEVNSIQIIVLLSQI